MFEDPFNVSKLVAGTAFRRRMAAFIVVSTAVFLAICLVWPLTVTGYRNVSAIQLEGTESIHSPDVLKPILATAIHEEISANRLPMALQDTESRIGAARGFLFRRKAEDIANSVRMGVSQSKTGYQLQIVYDGEGTEEEREFVDVLAERIAYRLASGRMADTNESAPLLDGLVVRNTERHQKLEQLKLLLGEVNQNLNIAKTSLSRSDGTGSKLALDRGGEPFHLASSQKIVSGTGADEAANVLSEINMDAVTQIVADLETLDTESNEKISVGGVARSKTTPIDGVPNGGALLMIIAVSGLIGSIIAWHCDPFENRGFDNHRDVTEKLGVPVVGLMQSTSNPVESDHPWASTATKYCGLFLLGYSIVVVGFLMVNESVREAFMGNPFYGMSRIVQILLGY